jgi:precorrin-6B methylase 2
MRFIKNLFNFFIGKNVYLLITPFGFNRWNWSVLKKNSISQFIGTYEKNLIPYIVSNIKQILDEFNKPIIFDIGSSYGYYSSYFSKFNNCKVVAFEPDNRAFQTLKNIQKKRNNLILKNLEINEDKKENTIDFQSAIKKFGAPNLIKIDIEGYEKKLLCNNLNYFKNNSTVIIVEVHSLEIENSIKLSFENIGYHAKIIYNDVKTLKIRNVNHNRWLIIDKKS